MKLPSFKLKHLFSLRREEAFHAGFRTRDPNVIDSENTCTASYASLCGAASRGRSEERKEEDKVKEMGGKERRNRYRKASRNRFTGSKFQGPRVATKPQRKLFLEGHLPRRSRRSNRTENTEPRTDNGWSWTTRPPGSLSSSSFSSTPFLSLSLALLSRNNNGPLYAMGRDPLSIVSFFRLSLVRSRLLLITFSRGATRNERVVDDHRD